MNGRAWFALGTKGVVFSDSGFPCRVSNTTNVQALTTNDGLPVTAVASLELSAPLTGGIVQGLIVFQGASKMQQITGDPATGNLAMNALTVATGTRAPLSIAPCAAGTAFISPQGLHIINFDGSITGPIGIDGKGITQPFQFPVTVSRICASANVSIIRISVQNSLPDNAPFQEYWYDLARGYWSGPHSFPARLIQPWRGTFVEAPQNIDGILYQSDAYAGNGTVYTEAGNPLGWIYETILLPDNEAMAMNAMVEANLAVTGDLNDPINVIAFDEFDVVIDAVVIMPGALLENLRERLLAWHVPIIFKQMSLLVSGQSDPEVRIGNYYMRHEILGYNLDDGPAGLPPAEFWLLWDDGVTILEPDSGTGTPAPLTTGTGLIPG